MTFWDGISYSPICPHYADEDNLEFLILLSPSPTCCHYNHVPLWLTYFWCHTPNVSIVFELSIVSYWFCCCFALFFYHTLCISAMIWMCFFSLQRFMWLKVGTQFTGISVLGILSWDLVGDDWTLRILPSKRLTALSREWVRFYVTGLVLLRADH